MSYISLTNFCMPITDPPLVMFQAENIVRTTIKESIDQNCIQDIFVTGDPFWSVLVAAYVSHPLPPHPHPQGTGWRELFITCINS